jgi:acyl carrier protein
MTLNEFIEAFAEEFDDTELSEFKPETEFKPLDEWSSLTALSIISMVDEQLDKTITGADIRGSKTIEDLYNLVMAK